MLYRDGTNRIVGDAEEEAAAQREGFTRTAPSPFAEGYPRWFCEKPTHIGGTRGGDLRHVTLNNPAEEKLFHAVVEESDWMADSVKSAQGARGVALIELIEERKERLRQVLDAEFESTQAFTREVSDGIDPGSGSADSAAK
jgi:hypothetical protein